MIQILKINRVILIILTGFLSFTAIAGGITLLIGFFNPPVELLAGSLFSDYTIPGLALAVIVGGGALVSMILLIRKNKYAVLTATVSGIIIMFFEFVEVLVIGSEGFALALQLIYYGLGILIVIFSISSWYIELKTASA
jgi:hypothetical protein